MNVNIIIIFHEWKKINFEKDESFRHFGSADVYLVTMHSMVLLQSKVHKKIEGRTLFIVYGQPSKIGKTFLEKNLFVNTVSAAW